MPSSLSPRPPLPRLFLNLPPSSSSAPASSPSQEQPAAGSSKPKSQDEATASPSPATSATTRPALTSGLLPLHWHCTVPTPHPLFSCQASQPVQNHQTPH